MDFKRDPWPKVSDAAKDLVKKMLNPDPKLRLTAQEVLGIKTYRSNLPGVCLKFLKFGTLLSFL